jgi:hypothetical protein
MHAPSKKKSGRQDKSNDTVEVWLQPLELATHATKIRQSN